MVRYLLLAYESFVTNGMRYTATYWGVQGFSADKSMELVGVPAVAMPENSIDVYQGIVKEYLKKDLAALNIPELEVLLVDILSVKSMEQSRRFLHGRSVEYAGIDVETTVAGQYKPPPDVNFDEVLEESLERGSNEITEKLKESGDPYFEDLVIIDVKDDGDGEGGEEDEEERKKRRSKSKVGLIFLILFLILLLVALVIAAIIFYRRRMEKELDEDEKILDDNTFGTNDYGDFYNREHRSIVTGNVSKDEFASVITDPTYRGGQYDEIENNGNNGSQYYDEDMFDEEEDAGTFTGHSIIPDENDDVSALQSVRGVEDGWTTESSRRTLENISKRTLDTNYETSEHYQSTDDYNTLPQSGYDSQTSGLNSRQSISHTSAASLHYSDSPSDNEREMGYQSQGTGYVSQGNFSRGQSVNMMSVVSAPTVSKERDDAFTVYSQARTNVSAPTFFQEEESLIYEGAPGGNSLHYGAGSSESNGHLQDQSLHRNSSQMAPSTSQISDSRASGPRRTNSAHSLNNTDEYEDALETQSYTSAPTIVGRESRDKRGDSDNFSLVSIESFASAPTVMADQPASNSMNRMPLSAANSLSKIEEEEEAPDMQDRGHAVSQTHLEGICEEEPLIFAEADGRSGIHLNNSRTMEEQANGEALEYGSEPFHDNFSVLTLDTALQTVTAKEKYSDHQESHNTSQPNQQPKGLHDNSTKGGRVSSAKSLPGGFQGGLRPQRSVGKMDTAQSVPDAYRYSDPDGVDNRSIDTRSMLNESHAVASGSGAKSMPGGFQGGLRPQGSHGKMDTAQSVPDAYRYSDPDGVDNRSIDTRSMLDESHAGASVSGSGAQSMPSGFQGGLRPQRSDGKMDTAQSVPDAYKYSDPDGFDNRSVDTRSMLDKSYAGASGSGSGAPSMPGGFQGGLRPQRSDGKMDTAQSLPDAYRYSKDSDGVDNGSVDTRSILDESHAGASVSGSGAQSMPGGFQGGLRPQRSDGKMDTAQSLPDAYRYSRDSNGFENRSVETRSMLDESYAGASGSRSVSGSGAQSMPGGFQGGRRPDRSDGKMDTAQSVPDAYRYSRDSDGFDNGSVETRSMLDESHAGASGSRSVSGSGAQSMPDGFQGGRRPDRSDGKMDTAQSVPDAYRYSRDPAEVDNKSMDTRSMLDESHAGASVSGSGAQSMPGGFQGGLRPDRSDGKMDTTQSVPDAYRYSRDPDGFDNRSIDTRSMLDDESHVGTSGSVSGSGAQSSMPGQGGRRPQRSDGKMDTTQSVPDAYRYSRDPDGFDNRSVDTRSMLDESDSCNAQSSGAQSMSGGFQMLRPQKNDPRTGASQSHSGDAYSYEEYESHNPSRPLFSHGDAQGTYSGTNLNARSGELESQYDDYTAYDFHESQMRGFSASTQNMVGEGDEQKSIADHVTNDDAYSAFYSQDQQSDYDLYENF